MVISSLQEEASNLCKGTSSELIGICKGEQVGQLRVHSDQRSATSQKDSELEVGASLVLPKLLCTKLLTEEQACSYFFTLAKTHDCNPVTGGAHSVIIDHCLVQNPVDILANG